MTINDNDLGQTSNVQIHQLTSSFSNLNFLGKFYLKHLVKINKGNDYLTRIFYFKI